MIRRVSPIESAPALAPAFVPAFMLAFALAFALTPALPRTCLAEPGAVDSGGAPREVQVSVQGGRLIGTESNDVVTFKGVPYAAPPVGRLRWRAPQPPLPWPGAQRAADYGASCPQAETPRHVPPGSRGATTSEDCLTLNVWAPRGAHGAPVIVWIHGGGNQDGTSAQTYYDGSSFARDSVEFVSFNYRLGLFGFFAHPALAREQGPAERANFGLLDQIAALHWVRANIAAFGGDPARVTVMGESAGGQDIVALLTSPAARGLFQRAIVESAGGGWSPPPSLADAEATGVAAVTAAGAAASAPAVVPLGSLRALPADALVRAGLARDLGPAVDGALIPEAPLAALAAGHCIHVPLLIGTNDGEGSLLDAAASPDSLFPRLSAAQRSQLRAEYGAPAGESAAFARLLLRDAYFAGPARFIARRMAQAAPVYLYRFEYVASVLRRRRENAYHGSEIPFVFQTFDPAYASASDQQVMRDLHDCWVAFARTGVPKSARAPVWPALQATDARMMVFGDAPSVQALDHPDVFELLERALSVH